MKLGKLMILVIAALAAVYIGMNVVPAGSEVVVDSHEGHDHGEDGHEEHAGNEDQAALDEHEGHDHGEAGHAAHDDSSAMQFSQADMDRFGIEVGRAGAGEFEVHVSIPGEIKVNSDRMAHIIPTVGGVVRQVSKKLGDTVKAGEIIVWLESPELGNAKIDYLGKSAEVNCCSLDLTRAEEIHDNTVNLLA
ncbi:MAG: efflux RND transporter periplasmic adaptor subunit, partial [Planctomycetes bacterium]|nr:efflux RND transporter periplasmic adaptor subunit [Planctomycetota bacterium]